MDNKYLEHIATRERFTGTRYRILLLLAVKELSQTEIGTILVMKRPNVSIEIKKLLEEGYIIKTREIGAIQLYRAVTDVKKLNGNIKGQVELRVKDNEHE